MKQIDIYVMVVALCVTEERPP